MLEMMRSNKFFSVFLLTAITIMITVAFVFWGIGPKDNAEVQYVAEIGDTKVNIDYYWKVYDNEFKRLKEQYPDEQDIEGKFNVKDRVLYSIVDEFVLLTAADQAGINATDVELQKAIISTPWFQRNGIFDEDIYKRALRQMRTSAKAFEANIRNSIILTKMSRLIGETAELSLNELAVLDSIKGGNQEQLHKAFMSNKTNQVIKAYIEGVKKQLDIKINRDLIL